MRLVSVGEILWDVIGDQEHLGGAPFNLAAHASRLGHEVALVSAVGRDRRGDAALALARALGLSTRFIGTTGERPTGAVTVTLDPGGQPDYVIHRPAAYDFASLDAAAQEEIAALRPQWITFGTLHALAPAGRALLATLLAAAPGARRFYDVNLRKDSFTPALVLDLLACADVVKLNDDEVLAVERMAGEAHESLESFCRRFAARFGWQGVCVTQGARGCAVLLGGDYVEAKGYPARVADTVGAGDAFAAAFLHGLDAGWTPAAIGDFANRLGSLVASRPGAVPEWSMKEVRALGGGSTG